MRRQLIVVIFIFFSFLLTSCHYQFGYGNLSGRYQTISIPYVIGDQTGDLTGELIKKISTSGAFRYCPSGGNLILQVELLELDDENIGFRYDRKKRGDLKKTIIPTETRLTGLVEIKIIDSSTQKVVRGPTRISASVEFDHNYYFTMNAINIFSLGQLSDVDAAYEAAMHPLNQQLAEKITDYVTLSW